MDHTALKIELGNSTPNTNLMGKINMSMYSQCKDYDKKKVIL